MNKPRIVTFTSIMLVVFAFISMFGANGYASSRSASALARDLHFIETTPTIPYTPEAFIPVRMSALNSSGAAREELLCATPDYSMYYGCTAFCRDDDPAADEKCNREQKLAYPYGTESVPQLGVENDYLPDVLSQEMDPSYENNALGAGAITMRSFALQQFEELSFQGKVLNNSTQYQTFIPYKFDTLNSDFPGSTCGLPDPLINDKQKKICEAVAPRYYISSIEKGDYPAQANHFADVPYRTDDASYDDPALVSVEDPISTEEEPCIAWQESVNTYGLSQKGTNRWARGNRCGVDTPGEPWSVQWTTAEQILFHYYTGVQLRDADNDKKIISPDWRWNPLDIRWNNTPSYEPPSLQSGTVYTMAIQLQNTGINSWPCWVTVAEQMPIPPGFSRFYLRYRWARPNGQVVIGTGQVGACGLTPGQAKTVQLTLNDVPLWPADTYTLSLDIQDADRAFWFSTGGWPTYDIAIKIIAPPTPTPRPSPTVTVCPGC